MVCAAAGLFTAGVLLVDPDSSSSSSSSSSSPTSSYPSGDAAAGDASLEISDFAFGAATAAPGATVSVVNRDAAAHTVTATGGAFDTGSIGAGATATLTAPLAPGSYEFFCAIHPSMSGLLVVA